MCLILREVKVDGRIFSLNNGPNPPEKIWCQSKELNMLEQELHFFTVHILVLVERF